MSASTKTALKALLEAKIVSGGRRTSAANLRLVHEALIDSLIALIDDKNVIDGYLGIDASGKVDNSFINFPASPAERYIPIITDFTDHGNVSTGETLLFRYNIPAATLSADGDAIQADYFGSMVITGGSDTRELKVYFNGIRIFDTTSIVPLGTSWIVKVQIVRSDTDKMRFSAQFIAYTGGLPNIINVDKLTAIDFAQPIEIKITGQSSASSDDIVLKACKIYCLKAS